MKKFNPKLIMIDVDGTLVDSVPDLAYCVDELMVTMGREKWGEAQVRHWVGNGVPKLVERALTGELEGRVNKDDYDKAYPIFLDLYTKNTSGRSLLYPGVREGQIWHTIN
jgi:phosphoglycolate phosphatase